MSEQLCHCNCPLTVISQVGEGSRDSAPTLLTGSARLYATPPIAEDEEISILEDVVPVTDRAEDEGARIEDQEVPLPIPPPQTQVVDLGPAVSLQACICQILKRVNGQRRPFSLVRLWSGAIYDLRDPSKYLQHQVGACSTAGVQVAGPYAQGYQEHGARHPDDRRELVCGRSMDAGESLTSEGDGESGPDFSQFSMELNLGGLGPSHPMGQ